MPLLSRFRLATPLALAGYVLTLATPALAQHKAAAAAPAGEERAPAPAAVPNEEQAGAPEADPAVEVSPLTAHQRETLRKSLLEAQQDHASTTTLLPWVVVGTGAALIVAGLLIGAESSWGCGDRCSGASALPAWLVVGGTTAGMAGMVWLLRTERDIAQIETREYRIKSELERMDWNLAPYEHASMSPSLRLRGSF